MRKKQGTEEFDMKNHSRHQPHMQLYKSLLAALLVVLGTVGSAQATELDITAKYKADPARPAHNDFVNTTPNSGYCASYPTQCTSFFSLRFNLQSQSNKTIVANHADPRQGAMFIVPTQWKDLVVTHQQTGEQKTVKIRIQGFGTTYDVKNANELVGSNEGHRELWKDGTWFYAPSPCKMSGLAFGNHVIYGFFWLSPTAGTCAKQALFDIPWMHYKYLDLAYELQTPNPLTMSSGVYTGSITYTAGPHQDFDFGDVMIPDDSEIKLNFTLTVEHTLKVEIPPGGNKIVLAPKDGWHQWLQRGRTPEKLYRDQTFILSATSRFKMQLECGAVLDDTCALTNTSGHKVPLDISVTLPTGINRADGSSVNRQPLLLSGAGTQLFQPGSYIVQRPGTLHFEVQKKYVSDMLLQKGKYTGNVVVIWDSEV